MCFSQQAAHMEELIMESRSDVISLAIPGYELRLPQCCWSSAATSVFWGRERILDVSGAVGFDFLLRNHWEAVIWFPQRERDVWGQGIVYSWGLLRNFLESVSHISQQKSRKQSKCVPFPFMWRKLVPPCSRELCPRQSAQTCYSVCILLGISEQISSGRLVFLWWFKSFYTRISRWTRWKKDRYLGMLFSSGKSVCLFSFS